MKKFTLLIMLFLSMIGISQNLLTNGDFENGTTGWAFGSPGTVAGGEAFYSSTNAGGNLWDTQLVQAGMSFTSGTEYTLTFKARANANRNITVAIQNVGIWNDQFRQSYALTTTMQTFTATFIAPSTNGNVQIGFLMAGQGSTDAVYFDDVEIVENEGGGGDIPPAQPVGFVANTPTSSSVFMAVGPNNVGGEIEYRLFYSPTATAPANPLNATQYFFGSTPGDGNGFSAFGFTLTGLDSGTNYTFWLYQYNSTTGLYSSPNAVTATTTSAGTVPQPVGFVAINPTSTSMFLAVGPNNVGGNIVYRLFYSPTATAPANPLNATEYVFGSTPGDGNGTAAFGFNLSGLSSSTNYTFWLYQYNTASMIYSTPGMSTNTTLFAPAPLVPPTTNAPVPTRNPTNVVSIYSDSYSDIATNYDPNWGQSGHNLVNPTFEAVSGSGNNILHYANFNYQGTEVTATDLSSMEFLHIDLWTNAATSNAIIQVSPINAGSGPAEVLVTISHIQGQWVSVDIPKSAFGGMTWDNVVQMKFAANGPGSTTPIDIYLDNVYFWNNPGVSTDATLNDLQVDFASVDGFDSAQLTYTYNIPFGTTEIPQITSATPNSGAASVVITQASTLPGSATVLVTAEDDSVQQTYTVNFSFPPPPAQPVGFVAFNPTASTAFLACGPNNVDGNIIYRLFYAPTATAPVDPTTAPEYNFGDTAGDGGGAGPFGFNIPGLNSSTNYTFYLYQYNIETSQFSSPGTASLTTLCLPVDWYNDIDGDGFGVDSTVINSCDSPGTTYVLVGGDCDDTNNTVYPGATEICYDGLDNDCDGIIDNGCTPIVSVVQPAQCGITLPTIDSYVYANLVAGAQGYRFRVTNLSTNEVQTIDRALRVFRFTQLTNYAFATEYSVEVSVRINNVWQPFYGTPCNVSTPDTTTQVQASQCNTVISNVNNAIFADIVPFATGYRFRVTNTLNPIDVQTIDRPIRDFRMNLLSNIQFNTTYNVEVAVRNTDGEYLSYGPVCNITTPLFPTVGLEDAQCDEYLVSSNTEILYAESYPGVEQYRFLLENVGLAYSQTVDRATRTVTLNNFSGLVPGEMYTVRVAIRLNGVWGPYGKSCSIITPGGEIILIRPGDSMGGTEFKAIAYPNPFETSFTIDVRTSNTEAVSLTVYDMTGRLLEVKEVKAQDVTNYQFGEGYPSGVYNLVVTQGEETRTVRMIKN
ncbi:carbohydrate binding domain-containing protein [Flavobacterium sp.]|uniref:carbohydrate binding domain-containing protein n=1 Tax=Flavobacterium sp. TaxID=239 RepID=UPI00352901FE